MKSRATRSSTSKSKSTSSGHKKLGSYTAKKGFGVTGRRSKSK